MMFKDVNIFLENVDDIKGNGGNEQAFMTPKIRTQNTPKIHPFF